MDFTYKKPLLLLLLQLLPQEELFRCFKAFNYLASAEREPYTIFRTIHRTLAQWFVAEYLDVHTSNCFLTLTPCPCLTQAARAGCCPRCWHEASFSPITLPLLEPTSTLDSYSHAKGICAVGCCCQMTWTPSIPGSSPGSRHLLGPCVCHQWLGESPYGHDIAHLSLCLNKALFITCCQTPLLFGPQHVTVHKIRHQLKIQN